MKALALNTCRGGCKPEKEDHKDRKNKCAPKVDICSLQNIITMCAIDTTVFNAMSSVPCFNAIMSC